MSLSVIEVSRQTGLHPNTIRSLDRRGWIKSSRDINGWRVFPDDAVQFILEIYRKRIAAAKTTKKEASQG